VQAQDLQPRRRHGLARRDADLARQRGAARGQGGENGQRDVLQAVGGSGWVAVGDREFCGLSNEPNLSAIGAVLTEL
jgi:hypothetical protein